MIGLWIAIFSLSFLDALFTQMALDSGCGIELNPIMKNLMCVALPGFWIFVKTILTGFACSFLIGVGARRTLFVVAIFYVIIVVYGAYGIFSYA